MTIAGRVYAAFYDHMITGSEKAGLADQRRALLAGARGRVLEIGAGTGANLPHYGDEVETLTVTEPDEAMARRLEQRAQELGRQVDVVRAPVEQLPFDDGSFDVAVRLSCSAPCRTSSTRSRSSAACSCPADACSSSSMFAPTSGGSQAGRTG